MYGLGHVNDTDFDDSIRRKIMMGNNSGYLDEQYEVTKDFPNISDYHFRIQDEHEIMQLEKLRHQNTPSIIQQSFGSSSDGFKSRLDSLISGLDQNAVKFNNAYPTENHGFYMLADNYDQESAVEAVLEKARIEELKKGVENLSLKTVKPNFINRKGKKKEQVDTQMKGQTKTLCKKFNRMTITEDDL